ncbi:hypothetical protein AAC387_Pa10g2164 [Persea americana]
MMGSAGSTGGGGGLGEWKYGQAKTSVWWDIENCHVPKGFDAHVIAQNISSALANLDYRGPVSISAYGDTNKILPSVQHALSSTGIALNHVPAGVKDASDKKILVDMLFWAVDNPPPANYLLISGDRDFSNALHQLRMRRYNILLAQPKQVSAPLVAAAKSVWLWTSLLAGGPALSADSPPVINPSSAEMPNNGFPDPTYVKQSVNSLPDSSHSGNQKTFGNNAKADPKFKGKLPRRNPNQSNISRTSSDEFRQPLAGTQGGPINGSSDISNQKRVNAIPQQNHMPTSRSSSMESLDSSQANYAGARSSFVPSTSSNVATDSNFPPPLASGFPQQPGYGQENQFKEAPHEFFGDNKPKVSSSAPPNFSARGPDPSWNNGNHYPNNYPFQYPQPLRPTDLLPSQPTFAPGNLFPPNPHLHGSQILPPRSDGPPFTSGPPTSIPEIGKLNISDNLGNAPNNPTFQRNMEAKPGTFFDSSNPGNFNVPHTAHPPHPRQPFYPNNSSNGYLHHGPDFRPPASLPMDDTASSNGRWGTSVSPQPSDHVLGLIGQVLLALNTLKNDEMAPTEANIGDCIRYGDSNLLNFNVRMALDSAIEQQMIVMHRTGAVQLYIQKNGTLWKCRNPLGATSKHPKATWDAIQKFLSSVGGRAAMMASQSRYHAATILKKSCLKHLVLGEILQILHVVVMGKKWITTHSSGWQPISITLGEAKGQRGTNAAT